MRECVQYKKLQEPRMEFTSHLSKQTGPYNMCRFMICVCVCMLIAQSWPVLCDPMDCTHQAPLFMEFSRQEYWSSHSLLLGIFLTQGSNPGLPQCRQILYHLSHQGSPFSVHMSMLFSICPTLYNEMDSFKTIKRKIWGMVHTRIE